MKVSSSESHPSYLSRRRTLDSACDRGGGRIAEGWEDGGVVRLLDRQEL
jgi:hypothetical protein